MRCVALAGPPPVRTYTSWKSKNVKMIENVVTMKITGISSGSVT